MQHCCWFLTSIFFRINDKWINGWDIHFDSMFMVFYVILLLLIVLKWDKYKHHTFYHPSCFQFESPCKEHFRYSVRFKKLFIYHSISSIEYRGREHFYHESIISCWNNFPLERISQLNSWMVSATFEFRCVNTKNVNYRHFGCLCCDTFFFFDKK